MTDATPLDLVSSMVIDTGDRWGEVATDDQWDDMRALLAPERPRWHFWLRARGRSKPLALDTPLATPSGWTTMGEVEPGDVLFDETGLQTTVKATGPVLHGEDCWRVTFDDGTSLIASGSHEWVVEDHRRRRGRSMLGISSPYDVPGGVAALPLMTTREMAGKLTFSGRDSKSLSVPNAKAALDLPDADLPLPPYILGYWLGDGTTATARVTIGDQDLDEAKTRFAALGYPLHSPTRDRNAAWRFGHGEGTPRKNDRGPYGYDSTRILRKLGVLNDKHIPMLYMRASERQRLELLRGLLDSDGYVVTGQAEFCNVNERLAHDVDELVTSFGWKARFRSYIANLNGKNCGLVHKVIFCPTVSPFHLTRKASLLPVGHEGRRSRHNHRMIWSIEPVPSVPVRCITVDSPSHLYLAGKAGIPTHNSNDVGAATLAMMLCGGIKPGDECYAAAAGREQAGILARKMKLITAATPELATAVDVQNFKVVTPRTGAVLDVISSDTATAWGKTPRWMFIDEIANHDATEGAKGFIDALITSLPKRQDSVCVAATTPSSPSHWSHKMWDSYLADPLWRCSLVAGPAPWQDPVELESIRRGLTPSMWRRLYLCEWAELDDQLATLEQVRACIGHDGTLPPDPRYGYVTTADLSYAKDVTAVSTCHVENRGGREILVLDRLAAWRPRKGKQVPLAEVGEYVTGVAREYGGPIVADLYQAVTLVQGWKAQGFQVKEAKFNPQENSRRASLLLSLIRERQLDLPDDPELFGEITSLRLAEGSTPGVLKLTTEASADHHFDRAMTLMLAAQELMSRPAGSWLAAYGTQRCETCETVYPEHWDTCPKCCPGEAQKNAQRQAEPPPPPVSPQGWASAYGAVRCDTGAHLYIARQHPQGCPKCRGGHARSPFGPVGAFGLGRRL